MEKTTLEANDHMKKLSCYALIINSNRSREGMET